MLAPVLMLAGAAAGAILAGAIPASVGQWTTRYAVPCVFVAAAGTRLRLPRSAPSAALSDPIT